MTQSSWRTIWVSGALLGVVGCADLLDYDSIEFEEAGGSGSGAMSGSGGDAGSGATGGSGAAGGSGATGATGGTGAGGSGGDAGSGAGGSGATGATGGSGAGGTGAGGTGATGATGATGGSSGGGVGGSGPVGPCDGVSCGSDQYCEPGTGQCHCLPGWSASGGSCTPNLPGDPLAHTEAQVCDMWRWGQTVTDSSPWTSGGTQCDPGTLSRAGLNDTVRRLNMFRWLVGLGPTADEDSRNETNRWCAVLASWNPPGVVPDAHHPPPGSTCFTEAGLAGTSSSNLAWGSGHPANAMDQFVEDRGVASLGHRRWIFNPPLGPVGIGYYAGGGNYGNAQCLGVFSSSFSHPSPQWTSWPPPGYGPFSVYRWPWSFHYQGSLSGATVRVVRESDGQEMSVTTENLTGGYGSYTTLSISIGFTPALGETYTVTVTTGSTVITYPLTPVSC